MGSYCIVICWERFKYNYCLVVIMCSLSLKTKRSMGNGLISGNAAGLFLGEVVWSVGWFLQSSRIFFQFFWPLELRLSNRTILIFLLMWHHLRLIFFLALGLYIYIYISWLLNFDCRIIGSYSPHFLDDVAQSGPVFSQLCILRPPSQKTSHSRFVLSQSFISLTKFMEKSINI